MKNKILITGTGRSGTTILVKLLSLLGLDTGYQNLTSDEIEQYINQNSRGGLEMYLEPSNENYPLICKAPQFYNRIPELSKKYKIKKVFVPMRDLEITAKSRAKHGASPGGLWNANDVNSQMNHNAKVVYQIAIDCASNDIPLDFIDFDRFTSDNLYAYNVYSRFCELASDNKHDFTSFLNIYKSIIDHTKITTK